MPGKAAQDLLACGHRLQGIGILRHRLQERLVEQQSKSQFIDLVFGRHHDIVHHRFFSVLISGETRLLVRISRTIASACLGFRVVVCWFLHLVRSSQVLS